MVRWETGLTELASGAGGDRQLVSVGTSSTYADGG